MLTFVELISFELSRLEISWFDASRVDLSLIELSVLTYIQWSLPSFLVYNPYDLLSNSCKQLHSELCVLTFVCFKAALWRNPF